MLVTQSRIMYKKLAQVSCTRTASNFDASFLYKKLRNHKKVMANKTNNKTTNRQQSTNKMTNHISQFWSRACKFLASNRALFYLMQDSCTRKNLYKKARHTVKFLAQVDLYKFHQHNGVKFDFFFRTGIRIIKTRLKQEVRIQCTPLICMAYGRNKNMLICGACF